MAQALFFMLYEVRVHTNVYQQGRIFIKKSARLHLAILSLSSKAN